MAASYPPDPHEKAREADAVSHPHQHAGSKEAPVLLLHVHLKDQRTPCRSAGREHTHKA